VSQISGGSFGFVIAKIMPFEPGSIEELATASRQKAGSHQPNVLGYWCASGSRMGAASMPL